MRGLLGMLLFVAMAFLCWGLYGPVLHRGQEGMGMPGQPSSLRPLICVGLAYFLIAVLVPLALLSARGERGVWTWSGVFWSFLAGAAGAVGALGITLAFKFGGKPIFVMPLVFGFAPVVNTLITMWMAKTFRQANPIFFSGVILVALGAAGVMASKPARSHAVDGAPAASAAQTAEPQQAVPAETGGLRATGSRWLSSLALVPLCIALTACCWGSYGPVLHKGQHRMSGSRLRPFLCVGLAYFAIAVLVPLPLLSVFRESGGWTPGGVLWSLGGGVAGALGALGIIMAFDFGGKPIYVMPLVFGGAPVVNTFTTIWHEGTYREISPFFYASLMLVIAGAVTVLVFAPRGKSPEKAPEPAGDSGRPVPPPADRPSEEPFDAARLAAVLEGDLDEESEETVGEEDTLGFSPLGPGDSSLAEPGDKPAGPQD